MKKRLARKVSLGLTAMMAGSSLFTGGVLPVAAEEGEITVYTSAINDD